MYYVISESVVPANRASIAESYYNTLVPEIHKISGFVSEQELQSPTTTEKSVTISYWEDEAAIKRWRNETTHLRIPKKASAGVFESYRIRVGPVVVQEEDKEDVSSGQEHFIVFYQRDKAEEDLTDNNASLIGSDAASQVKENLLDSAVYRASQAVWISAWRSKAAAREFERSIHRVPGNSVKRIQVLRDYTKADRKDAPNLIPGSL